MLQQSLFDLNITGWQVPLCEYRQMSENRIISEGTVFDIDLSRENPQSLLRLSGQQLELLCMYWGCPVSGRKNKRVAGILGNYEVYTKASCGAEYLKAKKASDLRAMLKAIGKNNGYLNKDGVINTLLAWADTVHEPFKTRLAEARHYQAVKEALQAGKDVPDEVIIGNLTYVNIERQAKGLPVNPAKMTTDEWLTYQNRVRGYAPDYRGPLHSESIYSSTWLETERHWQTVEQAINAKKILPGEVIADHKLQTERRNIEIQMAIPKQIYLQGDKVRYGDKIGRIQYLRSSMEGFGQEYVIYTGQTMVAFSDQWEQFVAPTTAVDLIELNPWIRNAKSATYAFKVGDYVAWDDLDGRHWLGHITMTGEGWVNIRLYSPASNPLLGPQVNLCPQHNPTLRLTTENLPTTEQAIGKHSEYWKEYERKPNPAVWGFLKRLHDLFNLELPEQRHEEYGVNKKAS